MTLHVDIPMHRNSYAAKEETNAAKDGIWIQYITKSKELPWIVFMSLFKTKLKNAIILNMFKTYQKF